MFQRARRYLIVFRDICCRGQRVYSIRRRCRRHAARRWLAWRCRDASCDQAPESHLNASTRVPAFSIASRRGRATAPGPASRAPSHARVPPYFAPFQPQSEARRRPRGQLYCSCDVTRERPPEDLFEAAFDAAFARGLSRGRFMPPLPSAAIAAAEYWRAASREHATWRHGFTE